MVPKEQIVPKYNLDGKKEIKLIKMVPKCNFDGKKDQKKMYLKKWNDICTNKYWYHKHIRNQKKTKIIFLLQNWYQPLVLTLFSGTKGANLMLSEKKIKK